MATPGAPPDLPEGVEMLDVAMAEHVVAVRREPFPGLRPGELRPNERLGDVEE